VAGTNGNNVANTMGQSADGLYLQFGSAGSQESQGQNRTPSIYAARC